MWLARCRQCGPVWTGRSVRIDASAQDTSGLGAFMPSSESKHIDLKFAQEGISWSLSAGSRMGGSGRASGPPREQSFEFFGPYIGPVGIVFGTPLLCYALYGLCGPHGCLDLSAFRVPGLPTSTPLFTWTALGVVLGWVAFQAALHILLPGKLVKGVVLRNGETLTYKLNGQCGCGCARSVHVWERGRRR